MPAAILVKSPENRDLALGKTVNFHAFRVKFTHRAGASSVQPKLRHTRTQLFFQSPDTWTDKAERAYDFRFIDRALQYIAAWDLKEVELAFAFEEPASITSVSLGLAALGYTAPAEAA